MANGSIACESGGDGDDKIQYILYTISCSDSNGDVNVNFLREVNNRESKDDYWNSR